MPGEKPDRRSAAQSPRRGAETSCQRGRRIWPDRCEEIPSSGRAQDRVIVLRPSPWARIDHRTPLPCISRAYLPMPNLAQRTIELGKHPVEEALAELIRLRALCSEVMET
jgi:hypothetical protein